LESLFNRYGIQVKKEELDMPPSLETVGNYEVKASFYSKRFENSFTFKVDIDLQGASAAEVI